MRMRSPSNSSPGSGRGSEPVAKISPVPWSSEPSDTRT